MTNTSLRKNLGRFLLFVVMLGFLALPQLNTASAQPNDVSAQPTFDPAQLEEALSRPDISIPELSLILQQAKATLSQPAAAPKAAGSFECCLTCEALTLRCNGTLQQCCRFFDVCKAVCARLGDQCGSCNLGP